MSKSTDIRIREITTDTEEWLYRSPIKFGGVALDRATILNVHCIVETRSGKIAEGFGSMPLGNVWAYPSKTMKYDDTRAAMKAVFERVLPITRDYNEFGHPIDITHALEPASDCETSGVPLTGSTVTVFAHVVPPLMQNPLKRLSTVRFS